MKDLKINKQNPEPDDSARATLTVREAARLLGIGTNQAYAAAHRGDLPVLKIGGRILVSRRALEEMLAGSKTA